MSDGALLQLVALGEADSYLVDKPIITYFKNGYNRHTNFSIESIVQKFKGVANFGEIINITISRHGDLIWRTYIEVTLSSIVTTDPNTYCNRVGFKLLKKVELRIGGKIIDYQYSHWMHIWTELTHTTEMKLLLNKMVGNKADDGQLGNNDNPGTLMIPLLFFFCRNHHLALPLIALQYHEIEIIIEFEIFNNLISDLNITNNIAQGTMSNVSIWVDYVFLDTEERKQFAQTSHDYLIETTQVQEISIPANKTSCVKLDFNHPTKFLTWALKDNSFIYDSSGTTCYTPLISSGGGDFTMVVRSDGYLWGWGSNASGQLGLGNTTSPQTVPVQITAININEIQKLFCGSANTFIIKQNGTLWGTGLNTSGQLGLGDNTTRNIFTQIGTDTNWSFISNKSSHTLAIKNDGTLWGTGLNTSGQLGLGNNTSRNTFIQIGSSTWITCSIFGTSSSAIRSDNTLWSTGLNTNGQLGLGDLLARNIFTQVVTAGINTWSKISRMSNAMGGIKTDGTLWTWGLNTSGQLGLGNLTQFNTPQQVGVATDYNNVYGSNATLYIKKNNGTVWATGNNANGLLGSGNYINSSVFVQIGSNQYIDIQTGDTHVWLIDSNYNMYFLGSNLVAQLGMNYITTYPYVYPTLYNDTDIWKSYTPILHIKSNGTLWAIGTNTSGQLGLGDLVNRNVLTQVGSDTNWLKVETAKSNFGTIIGIYSAAIKTDGTLWTWGLNTNGQLGLGNVTQYTTPQKVGTDTDWSKFSCGNTHMAAIKTDGTLWTWGSNSSGQLGLGNTTQYTTPQKVGVATDWNNISCGFSNTFAIKNNGTLWATGLNNGGQLGLGDTTNRNVFTQIGISSDWSIITTSNSITFIIKTDGTLWACGIRASLGLNNTTFTQVGSDTWLKISNITGAYVKGIKTDGTLWSWGNTDLLSLGTAIISSPQTFPLQLGTDTDWIDVISSAGSGLAIKSNNTKYIWGNNGSIYDYSTIYVINLTQSTFDVDNCIPGTGSISTLDNFTYYGSVDASTSSLSSAKLIVNNNERFRERDSTYFNYIMPYQHFNIKADLGINMYSFAINPIHHQPSGTFNLSKVHKLQLEITPTNNPDNNTDEIPLTLYIYAFSYNVLRIAEGMGGLAFNS
jgi:alpha-tubulin suppressor-like RCC1 family protein